MLFFPISIYWQIDGKQELRFFSYKYSTLTPSSPLNEKSRWISRKKCQPLMAWIRGLGYYTDRSHQALSQRYTHTHIHTHNLIRDMAYTQYVWMHARMHTHAASHPDYAMSPSTQFAYSTEAPQSAIITNKYTPMTNPSTITYHQFIINNRWERESLTLVSRHFSL